MKTQFDDGWIVVFGVLLVLLFAWLFARAFGPPPEYLPWLE